jgi:hypothetical protein
MRPPLNVELDKSRKDLIAQLDRFARGQRSSDGRDVASWRRQTITEQEEWLGRIVFSTSNE